MKHGFFLFRTSVADPTKSSSENHCVIHLKHVLLVELNLLQNPRNFDLDGFYAFCRKEIPWYAQPGFIRLTRELLRTATPKIRKPILMHDFIERTPEKDADQNDLIYRLGPDGIKEFKTGDYWGEMTRCTDAAVRARFAAATRRQNLFSDA
jgi:hypothetical protein